MDADEKYTKLEYPGLAVEVLELRGERKARVVALTVASSKWSASGIRLHSTPAQLVRRFGRPNSIDREGGKTIYSYVTPGNLGSVFFEFLSGRLVKIKMSETLC